MRCGSPTAALWPRTGVHSSVARRSGDTAWRWLLALLVARQAAGWAGLGGPAVRPAGPPSTCLPSAVLPSAVHVHEPAGAAFHPLLDDRVFGERSGFMQ